MPWLDVQDAYMRAWELRPTRAEPFYCMPDTFAPKPLPARPPVRSACREHSTSAEDMVFTTLPSTLGVQPIAAVCAARLATTTSIRLCRRLLAQADHPG